MKKIIVVFAVLLLLVSSLSVSAQGLYGGVRGGVNFSSLTRTTDAYGRVRGNVGAFIGYQFSKFIGMQVEGLYSFQGAKIYDVNLNLDYLRIPIMVRLKLFGPIMVEGGLSFNLLTSSLFGGDPHKGLNGLDVSVPLGVTVALGRRFEIGARYDIPLVKYNPNTTGYNNLWSINVAFKL